MTTARKKTPKEKPTGLSVPAAKRVKVEVVANNNAMDLAAISREIATEQERIDQHMDAAKAAMLPHALRIGLWCLKAQQVFAITDHAERGAMGGRGKSLSEADKLSVEGVPTSYAGWFAGEVKGVSRQNSYNYIRAVQGLGLDHTADVKQLDKALSKARKQAGQGKLSIAKLAHLGPKPESDEEEEEEDTNTEEDKAAESRAWVAEWTGHWDEGVKAGCIEDADTDCLRNLEEFLRNSLDRVKRRLKSAKADQAA